MADDCDHVLGIAVWPGEHEYVRASNRGAVAAAYFAKFQRWLRRGLGPAEKVARVRAIDTPDKALADSMDAFAYCPRCGTKLGAEPA